MRAIIDRLSSLNLWVNVASLLAAPGLVFFFLGLLFGQPELVYIGVSLAIPIVLVGFVALFVFVPILMLSNLKNKERDS
jgi:hypothetical protein